MILTKMLKLKAKRAAGGGRQTRLATLLNFGCRCAEVANSEVLQTLESLVRFQSAPPSDDYVRAQHSLVS